MLTREGSVAGPAWIRRLSETLAGGAPGARAAARRRHRHVGFWVVLAVCLALGWWTNALGTRGPITTPYESPLRVAGIPLLAYGDHARGVLAIGGTAVGVLAFGGVAVGAVAVGGVALGGLAVGGLSAGLLALAGLAVGWWAVGGGALGYYAFGGLAVGGYAYAGGGVALGYHQASGAQRERLWG
jgi:hypothetical protein